MNSGLRTRSALIIVWRRTPCCARREPNLPRAVLGVLLVLGRRLAELAVTARDLRHDLRLDALELVAIAQVGLGQLRLGELADDAAVGALVELRAQAARAGDALDDVGERRCR